MSSAMSGKWFAVKHGIQYLELYSGPGRLLDESTGVEQPGSPMRALSVRKPFTHYVLSDFSQGCIDALAARVGTRSDVNVVRGDANDPDHIERVANLLNTRRSSLHTSIPPVLRTYAGRLSSTSPRTSGSSTSSSTCR